jgi:hypothetical protein
MKIERNEKGREQKCRTKMTRRGGCGGSLGPDPEFFVSLQPPRVATLAQATAPRSVPLGRPRPSLALLRLAGICVPICGSCPFRAFINWGGRSTDDCGCHWRNLLRHSVRAYGTSDARSTAGARQLSPSTYCIAPLLTIRS